MEKLNTWFHGELTIHLIKELPTGSKKVKSDKDFYILADSENTGNHHVLEKKEGIELYERDGILYMKSIVPAEISCVIKERHDSIVLQPGIYEIDRAKEFDYLSMEKRNVAD